MYQGRVWKADFDEKGDLVKDSFHILPENEEEFLSHCERVTRTSRTNKNPDRKFSMYVDLASGLDVAGTFQWCKDEK